MPSSIDMLSKLSPIILIISFLCIGASFRSSTKFLAKWNFNVLTSSIFVEVPSRSIAHTAIFATKKVKNENPLDETADPQFLEWEQEEIEEYQRDLKSKASRLKSDESFADELPEYMLRMLSQFEDDENNDINSDPVPASKLPILAIIGRPNTGKSTLVNKLTNSFKVS